jgi:DNA polymerase elongation subunit (family B)
MQTRSSRRANERRAYTNAFWAGQHIVLLSRDERGELVRELVPAEHTSFIRKTEFDKHPTLRAVIEQSRFVLGWRPEGEFIRISWTTRDKSIQAAEKGGFFASHGIDVFEADVDPVRRFVTDNPIDIQKPKRAYLDLETDDRVSFSELHKMRILCWSVISHDVDPVTGKQVMQTGVLAAETIEAERELLKSLFAALADYDQVVAWNGDRFDFKVIGHRLQAAGLAVELRRWLWTDQMLVFERFDKASAESGEEKQSMSLAAVAASKLGVDEKKLVELGKVGGERTYAMWAVGGEKRKCLIEYCVDDTLKQYKIECKTGYLDLLYAVAEVTHTFPDTRGADPIQFVEGFLLRTGVERDYRFPTWYPPEVNEKGEREKFRGAWVQEPTKTGILHDVHVADFAGMYPTIIITWNMSLDTMRPEIQLSETWLTRPTYRMHLPLERYPIPEGHCAAPGTDIAFVNEPQGILPAAVSEIIRLRAHWNDEKKKHPPGSPAWHDANRRSAAFKIVANSFYGVMGSVWSRFFDKRLAESVTQAGVWLIQETSKAGEARGIKTVYGDTDSIFSMGVTEAEFRLFVEYANNELYPRLLKGQGCSRNRIKLEFEKSFRLLLLMGKKRYAGAYSQYKGKRADATSKPEIKGLEFKRGDVTRLARHLQSDVIDSIMAGELTPAKYEEIVMRYRMLLLEGQVELADIVQSKGLSKSLREYQAKSKKDGTDSALPAHVVVAKELKKRGQDVGQGIRVEYFVKDSKTDPVSYAPAEDWTGEFDRYHAWEKLVYPATERVLACAFKSQDWTRFARVRPAKEVAGGVNLFGAGTLAVPVGGVAKRVVRKPSSKASTGSNRSGQGDLF